MVDYVCNSRGEKKEGGSEVCSPTPQRLKGSNVSLLVTQTGYSDACMRNEKKIKEKMREIQWNDKDLNLE